VEQERAKQLEIWTDWKKEIGNNNLNKGKKGKRGKIKKCIYYPNFFLVMERSGFLLSSVNALVPQKSEFLCFLIQVLVLLTGTFSVFLPLLKVDILDCVEMDGAPFYWTTLGGSDQIRVFEPKLFLGGWAIWLSVFFCRNVVRTGSARNWYVSSHQPFQPTGEAWELELSFLVDYFFLGRLSVSAHYQFLKGGQCVIFPILWLGHPTSTQAGSVQHSTPSLPARSEIFPPFIWPPVLSRWGAILPQGGLLQHR
jgi:hypothetical protein